MLKQMTKQKPNKLIITNNILWYAYNTLVVYFSFFENQYFLFLGIVQLSTGILLPSSWSPTGRYSTILPLALCILIEIILVYKKYFHNKKIESEYNNKLYYVYDKINLCVMPKKCDELDYGDILISIDTKNSVPVDCILVEPKVCEISTILINGENNLRYIKGIKNIKENHDNINNLQINEFKINIVDYKQNDMFTCDAELIVNSSHISIPDNCFIPNGSIVKTKDTLLYVVGVGKNKKNVINSHKINKKNTSLETYISDSINYVNIKLLIAIIIGMLTIRILHQDLSSDSYTNLFNAMIDLLGGSVVVIIQSWIIFNNIIPFSVKILLTFMRCIQGMILNKKPEYQINNINIIDETPRINTILSDKTGTVTQGKLSIVELVQYDSSNNKIINCIPDPLNELTDCIANCINVNNNNTTCSDEDEILKNYCIQNNITSQIQPLPLNNLKFTYERKRSSNIVKEGEIFKIFTKGSIDSMKQICINTQDLSNIQKYLDIEKPNYRLLAFGYKELTQQEFNSCHVSEQYQSLEQDLKFTGIVCFTDSLVDNVANFINTCKQKKIKFNLCTGDRQVTSVEIAKQLGLLSCDNYIVVNDDQDFTTDMHMVFDDNIVTKYYEDKDFITCIRHGKNFVAYNMTPKSKEVLAKILNVNSSVVAIGDGHNDIQMFHQSQISIAIKNVPVVCEQADLIVDRITSLTNYFDNLAPTITNSNKLLVNYTFFRCGVTNISSLTYIGIQIYNYGFTKEFVGLFDGFTLVAFNFLWIIFPLIYHHININSNNNHNVNLKLSYKQIFPWIIGSIINGVLIILIGHIIFSNYYYEKWILSTLIIINLNVFYGVLTKLNWTILLGPILYLCYLVLVN